MAPTRLLKVAAATAVAVLVVMSYSAHQAMALTNGVTLPPAGTSLQDVALGCVGASGTHAQLCKACAGLPAGTSSSIICCGCVSLAMAGGDKKAARGCVDVCSDQAIVHSDYEATTCSLCLLEGLDPSACKACMAAGTGSPATCFTCIKAKLAPGACAACSEHEDMAQRDACFLKLGVPASDIILTEAAAGIYNTGAPSRRSRSLLTHDPCSKCNYPLFMGGCKCDSNCGCIYRRGGAPCDKCNWPENDGGCKCDSTCSCVPSNPCTQTFQMFTGLPFTDAPGNDLSQNTGGLAAAVEACRADARCRGVNNYGWLKANVAQNNWRSSPGFCLYIKPQCATPTCMGSSVPASFCGNGMCDPVETCRTCPADCGACPRNQASTSRCTKRSRAPGFSLCDYSKEVNVWGVCWQRCDRVYHLTYPFSDCGWASALECSLHTRLCSLTPVSLAVNPVLSFVGASLCSGLDCIGPMAELIDSMVKLGIGLVHLSQNLCPDNYGW